MFSPILSVDAPPMAAAMAEKDDLGEVTTTLALLTNIMSARAI